MSIEQIGCCGAYCGTCKEFREDRCKGCKYGYSDGTRDISKARCKMKVCCIGKTYESCADCNDYDSCSIIQGFYKKNGYKYKKYKESLDFIRANGYRSFIKTADTWKMQYGRLSKGT